MSNSEDTVVESQKLSKESNVFVGIDNDGDKELLESLLEESPEYRADLGALFEKPEDETTFFENFCGQVLQLWSANDKIIHIITPVGYSSTLKTKLESLTIDNLPVELVQELEKAKSIIQYGEHAEEKQIRIITLRSAMNTQELLTIQNWPNDPKINFYTELAAHQTFVQPTTEELRLLILMNTLLDIRAKNESKVLRADGSRLPSLVR